MSALPWAPGAVKLPPALIDPMLEIHETVPGLMPVTVAPHASVAFVAIRYLLHVVTTDAAVLEDEPTVR